MSHHGEHRQKMTRSALDSFMHTDIELARKTIARDDEVDQMYQQIFRELLTYMLEDPKNISRATFLLWVAHNLERIGDRATNLRAHHFRATGLMGDLQSGQTGPLTPRNRAFVTSHQDDRQGRNS